MVGSQDYIKHAKKRVYSLYNKRIKELRKKKKKGATNEETDGSIMW